MFIEAKSTPRIIWRKDSSICVNWENVFEFKTNNTAQNSGVYCSPSKNKPKNDQIYDLRILTQFKEWRIAYWGRKTETIIMNLKPCNCYNFKIKLFVHSEIESCESSWVEFKAATSTEQHYVHHLTRAIKQAKISQIRKIIANRPQLLEIPNLEDKTPLMQATEEGDLSVVTYLCNQGAQINAQSLITQRSALMLALFYGYLDIAEFILNKNAKINMKDINDRTAIFYAIDSNNVDSVQLAINRAADVNVRDNMGWTPLLRAVILETQDEIIRLLLKQGCDHTAIDRRGLNFRTHLELTNRLHLLKD